MHCRTLLYDLKKIQMIREDKKRKGQVTSIISLTSSSEDLTNQNDIDQLFVEVDTIWQLYVYSLEHSIL